MTMTATRETMVLLHGSATGSFGWTAVKRALEAAGETVFAPDMLGYGTAPAPTGQWSIAEEVAHLTSWLDARGIERFHLVTHSLGTLFGLHLRRALGARVTRLTLVDPVVVSILRVPGEEAALAEMDALYQRCMALEGEAAARTFVDHWSGPGAWAATGERARQVITALVPRLRLELQATRGDDTALEAFSIAPPPTTVLVGADTRVAPKAAARLLASSFGATTVVVPGAAHMIPLTHPHAVVAAVRTKETT